MSTKKEAQKSTDKKPSGFTTEEKAAMREIAKERKMEERMNKDRAVGQKAVLAKIAQMKGSDHMLAKRIHELVTTAAPDLMPKTWYGMPAYADKEGTVVCFFQDAAKFKARYATLGFSGAAKLDEGKMWPTSYALTELTSTEEAKIRALVKKAVGE